MAEQLLTQNIEQKAEKNKNLHTKTVTEINSSIKGF